MMETLNILSNFNGGEISKDLLPHLAVEAMRRGYQDRARYMGDPDFVDMPVDKLVSKSYAKARAAGIELDKATPSASLGDPVTVEEGFHTTHLSVLDGEGNRVAATLSINLPFGSAFVPPAPESCSTMRWTIFPPNRAAPTPMAWSAARPTPSLPASAPCPR